RHVQGGPDPSYARSHHRRGLQARLPCKPRGGRHRPLRGAKPAPVDFVEQVSLATVPEAVAEFKAGKFVIVVDDEDRENEGDLVVAAQLVTPDHVSFMTRHGSGLVCMPVVAKRLDELGIAPMVERNTSRLGTAFSVSIDARDMTTTGASAHDRAATIRKVLDPDAKASDFSMPGHTFPLRAAEGGVLTRAGQTEAAVDLATLAGLYPAGVITELMKGDGTMARMADIEAFANEHAIKVITVEQLIAYRRRNEKLHAYNLQDTGFDTVEANEALGHPPDKRDYGIGSQILYDLGVRKIRLLTNKPKKIYGLEGFGLEVVERVPIRIQSNPHNERYLKTKKDKLGHL